jgi:Zn-dependent alcohol dehydrogenase
MPGDREGPADTIPPLVELVRSGRLELADVVSRLSDLDGVPDAFARMRAGEGDRTAVVVDPALAGVQPAPAGVGRA